MSHKEDFSKWISAVEEGLGEPGAVAISIPAQDVDSSSCKCSGWDCPDCFPDMNAEQPSVSEVCPSCGSELHHNDCNSVSSDETDVFDFGPQFEELDEVDDDPAVFDGMSGAIDPSDSLDPVDQQRGQLKGPGRNPVAGPSITDPSEDVSELIGKIQYMQDMGLSASDKHYDVDQLINIKNPEVIRRICDKVTGNIHEERKEPRMSTKIYKEDFSVDEFNADDATGEVSIDDVIAKFKSGEIDEISAVEEFKKFLKNDDTDETEVEFDADDSEDMFDEEDFDDCDVASDILSGIEKKIAIAKAQLERKSSDIEEEEPLADTDHGLSSIGNKIVNAKLRHAGMDTEEDPIEDDLDVDDEVDVSTDLPDSEVMEWVARLNKVAK